MGENRGFEFVRGCWRQGGYWRKVPWTRKHPTLAQRQARYAFGKLAHDKAYGTTGMVLDGEREIPASAHVIKKHMKGRNFAPEKAKRIPEVLERLRPTLVAIGEQVSSMRAINSKVVPLLVQLGRIERQRKEEEKRKLRLPFTT